MKDPFKAFKTLCCKAPIVRISRANYRCTKCDEDSTMNYVYYAITVEENNLKELRDEKDSNLQEKKGNSAPRN